MKTFFKELFEYHFAFNQKILTLIAAHPNQVSNKILQLQSHIINAHGIWNSRIIPEVIEYKTWDIRSLEELITSDKHNFETSIQIVEHYDFNQEISYTLSTGKPCQNSIRDILFQITNHATHHRAQIATELKSCQINPPISDWIAYKMK